MHHTRATHNSHNETQRRLRKLVEKERGLTVPRYNIIHYKDDGTIVRVEPNWNWYGSNMVASKTHSADSHCDKDIESLEQAKRHTFYIRISKSKRSYWGFAKKRLHRIWRRKNADKLTFTYKDARGCSIRDLW